MFELEKFIDTYVIKRQVSMFQNDIDEHIEELSEFIKNKTVLVIGGAGTIGSAFIKSILLYEPSELCVVDINENGLTELTRDLRSQNIFVPEKYLSYPMDYSSDTFFKFFRIHRGFDIVANFAAHKHVRSEKDIFCIEAMLKNNVINAAGLLDLLSSYPPKTYFCVSTDKAANPVNIMGASKRIMEDLIFSYSDRFPVKTARFANVAFSNGSLPDGFIKRLEKKQPLSAPSDVKRYFVSPKESGQICMMAAILGNNREIFFPKLKEDQMESFDNIARDLLKEYGCEALECESDQEAIKRTTKEIKFDDSNTTNRPDKYPVHFFISDTSGEKEIEEFVTDNEETDMSRYEALGVVIGKETVNRESIKILIRELEKVLCTDGVQKADIVNVLKSYLPTFNHIETGKSLDSKM